MSHSIDAFTAAIKNIRNMHAVSSNQIADILHLNGITKCLTIYNNNPEVIVIKRCSSRNVGEGWVGTAWGGYFSFHKMSGL